MSTRRVSSETSAAVSLRGEGDGVRPRAIGATDPRNPHDPHDPHNPHNPHDPHDPHEPHDPHDGGGRPRRQRGSSRRVGRASGNHSEPGWRLVRGTAWTMAVVLPLAFLAAFFAYPVLAIIARGFTTGGTLDLSGVGEVLGSARTWRVVGHTLAQSASATVIAVVLAVPGAYVLYRCTWPGRSAVRGLVAVPFVLPSVVVGVAFRSVLAPGGPLGLLGLDRTMVAVVAALVFFNYGLVVRLVGSVWERLDPRAEQAARTLGASPTRAFVTVTLPTLAPAIVSAAALVFLFCATAFAVVLVLGGQQQATIEVEIWLRTTQFLDLRAASVLSIVQLVVVALTLWVSGRARARRERALHLVEARRATAPLRLGRRGDGAGLAWGAVVVTSVTVALIALPLLTMLVRSLRHDGAWTLRHYAALAGAGTTTGPGGAALSVSVWEATATSLRIAVDATVLALVVGVALSAVLSRRPRRSVARRALGALDAFVMLPLGVSAVTVGFGFLIALDRPPLDLRSSLLLIPVAQAMVAIPLVVRTVLPVLRAVDPRLRQAAAVLGAGPGRVLATVDAPLALRSIGLAAGFAFAVSLGEFGATSFLARPDRPTLPVVIYRLLSRPGEGNYGMALAASCVLALVVAVVMTTAERARPAHAGEW